MPEPIVCRTALAMEDQSEVKLKLVYGGQMNVQYIYAPMTLEAFYRELKATCGLDHNAVFTVKWVDEDGDPCTIESQRELDEAFRLYEVNRDNELNVHVFPSIPLQPGLPCQGEDKTVYRRGARRWKKYYRVNGHLFQAKRFNRAAVCSFCRDKIWGLGLQGYRCITCKLLIHKKCHKLIKIPCPGAPQTMLVVHQDSQLFPSGSPLDSVLRASVTRPNYPSGTSSRGKVTNGDTVPSSEMSVSSDEHRFESNADGMDYIPSLPEGSETSARRQESRFAVSLDDFDMLRVIGRGSYAKVLQVELKKNRKVYAMKIIKKSLVNDDEDIDWVQTEKHVFEVATNHPFLVGLHSCFQSASRLFFVIEFVPGGDMMFHMQRQRRLPEEHARFYSSEIILALHFLHTKGIIYRDLKLDNVLIDAEGHIKLTDYGMCKEGIKAGDTTSTFCGTPNYIAPEILRGEEYSFSVDWWALGVLMYEMMAGRSPFDIVGSADNPDASSEDYLFQVILEKAIRIPRSLSVKAASVLKGFLNKNAVERLGCHPTTGFQDIQNHPFFKSVEWELLEQKQVIPPYKPPVKDLKDLENFDRVFTEEPVVLTPDNSTEISKIDQSEFDGFEYINPLLMSTEDSV